MTTQDRPYNPFSGAFLDRRSECRLEPGWSEAARSDAQTRFVLGRGSRQLLRCDAHARIAFLTADHPLVAQAPEADLVLLGWHAGQRYVLVEAPPGDPPLPAGTAFEELRPLLAELAPEEAGLLSVARTLLLWRAQHRHCGVCGAPTRPTHAGHVLCCTHSACAAESHSRIDPAIIVLVTAGEQVLLGRQASWVPGRYSALAGFVEPGESLEDTVMREVYEETGVRVQEARYFASQSWPFPSSLMLGFHATAEPGPIRLDQELEDARWFSAAEIERTPGLLPPRFTIARRLLESWFDAAVGHALPHSL